MKHAVHIALLACIGCEPRPEPVDACTARLDVLEARLEQAARHADPTGAPPDVPLPSGRGTTPLESAPPILVVSDGELRLAGRGVGGTEDVESAATLLASDLRALASGSAGGSGEPWLVALWVDPAVEVRTLVAVLSRAPQQARFAVLVRAEDVSVPRPRAAPSWARNAVRAHEGEDPHARFDRIELAWERATSGCEPLRGRLPQPGSLAPEGPSLGAPSVGALVAALRDCGCGDVDANAVEALALGALIAPEGPLARLPHEVRFGPAMADGRPLAVRGDAHVADLVRRLARVPSGSLVWIDAE